MIWAKPNFHFDPALGSAEIERRTEEIKNRVGFLDLPDSWVYVLSCAKILALDYGYLRSHEAELPCDADGNAIPLYTYPLIEYLQQLDLSDVSVFEFGSGQSSLFWRERARRVVSVENNRDWFERISRECPANHTLVLKEGRTAFCDSILAYEESFDVIVVDGAENRYECAVNAVKKLNQGGFVILDNSDWYPNTAQCLRESNLIQMDLCGFKPTAHHTSVTSLFLHRAFNIPPLGDRQPRCPLGGLRIHSNWDNPLSR